MQLLKLEKYKTSKNGGLKENKIWYKNSRIDEE